MTAYFSQFDLILYNIYLYFKKIITSGEYLEYITNSNEKKFLISLNS